jgi:DnaJ family protein A protein 2
LPINVSLDEFYNGTEKKFKISRNRYKKDAKGRDVLVEETKKFVVPIEKGSRDEQVIRYNKQADEAPGHDTGDIVIVLKENGNNYFEREGDNLFVVKKISLYESYAAALGLINLTIKTLDNRILRLDANGICLHDQDGLRKIEGEGMPINKRDVKNKNLLMGREKGDLYVRFHLILPDKFDVTMVNKLKQLFPPVDSDIIYNDGCKDGMDITDIKNKIQACVLKEITEEDLENLNYDEYSDEEDEEERNESRPSNEEEYD